MTEPDNPGNQPPSPPTPPPLPPENSAPRVVPTTADEALEIGRAHFPPVGSPEGPMSLFVHEFDIGYLVYAGWPAPEDPDAPPLNPGGSNIAISKVNGDITTLPNYPPESAVEVYRKFYRPSDA